MATTILVPLDGSALAAQALPYAEVLARATGSTLTLAESVTASAQAGETLAAAEERVCQEAQERLNANGTPINLRGLAVRTEVAIMDPATFLSNLSHDLQASFIVMATHGRSGPSRWVMGSVAEQTLRRAHVPTLLLTPRALAAGDPGRLRRPMIVATDGSNMSQRIFAVVKQLAHQLAIPLTLVQAIDPMTLYGAMGTMGDMPYAAYSPELLSDWADGAQKELDALATTWRNEGLSVQVQVSIGQPLATIENAITSQGAGWVALASHGRGGLGGLVLGSTSLAVLRDVAVPVLISTGSAPEAVDA